MSQGAYRAPDLGASTGPASQGPSQSAFPTALDGASDDSKPVAYLCGECDARVFLRKGDAIRCKDCGYRVLYKERTSRMIQFEAR